MESLYSKIVFKTVKTVIAVSYSLCLGSIASFIAMDISAGKKPTVEFWFWQRIFVNQIMNNVTTPGVWLFMLGNIGLFFTLGKERKKANMLLLILSILVVVNVQINLNPIAKTINQLSVQQFQTTTFIKDFTTKKNTEDTFGGINLLLLLVYLAIYILNTSKPQFELNRNEVVKEV